MKNVYKFRKLYFFRHQTSSTFVLSDNNRRQLPSFH